MNSKNLIWNCEHCYDKKSEFMSAMKSFKLYKEAVEENSKKINVHEELLRSVNEKLNNLTKIQSAVDNLLKKSDSVYTPGPTPKRSFASVVQSPTSLSNTPLSSTKRLKTYNEQKKIEREKPANVLVIKVKEGANETATNKHSICKMLDPKKDPVSFIKSTTKGKTLIFCNDEQGLAKMKEKLIKGVGDKYDVNEPKSHKPRLKIVGDFDPEYTVTEITDFIQSQNKLILPFTVEKIKHHTTYSTFELSCGFTLFQHLLNLGKIKIGWSNAKVYEHVDAIICYKCNKIGHIEKDCTSPDTVCPKCSGPHKINECQSTELKCPTCCKNNEKLNVNLPTNHLPWSYKCPVYSKKVKAIKKRIQYEK